MTKRKNRKLLFIGVLTVALLLAITSIAMAYVGTDKPDYAPGSVVTISGDNRDNVGYLAGETVAIHVEGPNGYIADCEAVVGNDGAWSCQVTLDSDPTVAVGDYTYTATVFAEDGITPLIVESGTFTDANLTIKGSDGSQHLNIQQEENLGVITIGDSLQLICPRGTGLTLSSNGFGQNYPIDWTIGYYGTGSNNTTLSPLTTLTNSSGSLSENNQEVCVAMVISTSSLTSGTTYHGLLQMTARSTNALYYFKFTVAAPTDTTPPVVTLAPDRDPDSNDWYNAPVTFTVTGEDETSDVVCDDPIVYSGPDSNIASVTGYCTDEAGNEGSATAVFQYDATPPVVTLTPDRSSDSNGWYNHKVTFTVFGEDATSDNVICDDPIDYSGSDSATASVTGYCTDEAGNKGSATAEFKYDATAPTITITAPIDGGSYSLNEPVASNYACSDITSGIATCNGPVDNDENFDTSAVGPNDFKVTATDKAGNTNSLTHTYYVNYIFDGFFAPVNNPDTVNSAKAGQAIPIKWRLTDFNGDPVEVQGDWSVVANLTGTCGSGPVDAIETYAGSSGWQYLGDGYWQFNWKTPKYYAGLCLTMMLDLGDENPNHIAYFKFK
jgi:hypothetical protein